MPIVTTHPLRNCPFYACFVWHWINIISVLSFEIRNYFLRTTFDEHGWTVWQRVNSLKGGSVLTAWFFCVWYQVFVVDRMKRACSHLPKESTEKGRETWSWWTVQVMFKDAWLSVWTNKWSKIVGTNKQMVQGWNKLSKRRYFRIVSQLERCPVIGKRHPNPHVLWETSSHLMSGRTSVAFRKVISLQVY